jgi:AraC-like DNA-binding protein
VRYRHDAGVAAAVRRRLARVSPKAWLSFTALAGAMRIKPSTLRHHLHDEGQSYAAIKDEIRRDFATEMLVNTQATIADVAAELGYSEPSAFFRAFRKWTGKTPDEFRRLSRENA